jgi:2,3-bisphosphoglycerate-independent phosphoglycerate mutase
MSRIMVVIDGLQDISYPNLDGKTPYDWGKAGGFAEIESACVRGSLATTPEGMEPDTLNCVLTVLGVGREDIPAGRTAIEALAVGVPVGERDLVLRCNFVKITPDGILEDPTCAAPEDIANGLRAAVSALPGVRVTPVGSYKSLQVIEGGGENLIGMVTFPPHNYSGRPLEQLLPRGNAFAEKLAAFSREKLREFAPYTVLNWAASVPAALPMFSALHGGMAGAMVSATHAPMGGAIAMGMACPMLASATGDTDTDLAAKLAETLRLAGEHDFVMLHIGGTDEATHRFDAMEKAEFVRKIDAEVMAPLIKAVPDGTRVMVTCDHVALCSTGGHTAEPVGFMLWEKGGAISGDMGVQDGKKAVEIMGMAF